MNNSQIGPAAHLPAEIWSGWRHVFAPVDRLSAVHPLGLLDPQTLDADAYKLIQAIAWHLPEVMPIIASSVRVNPDALEAALEAVALLAGPKQSFRFQRRVIEVIDAGNRAGYFVIPIPWVPAPQPPPAPSPFVHADFKAALALTPLIKAYEDSLAGDLSLSPDACWGRIYFSAMFYGGLLRASWLRALSRALPTSPSGDLRWIDINLQEAPGTHVSSSANATPSNASTSDTGLRRWIIDPLSRLLLASVLQSGSAPPSTSGRSDNNHVIRCLRAYGRAGGFLAKVPRDLRGLFRALKTRYQLVLPSHLVHYASGSFANSSLPPRVWERMLRPPSRRATNLTALPTRRRATALTVALDSAGGNIPAEALEDFEESLRALIAALSSPRANLLVCIGLWRAAYGAKAPASVVCLAEWIERSLLVTRPGRNALPQGKILRSMICAGGPLVALLANDDPRTLLDEDSYVELYEGVLEELKGVDRREGAAALRDFHEFLVTTYHAPELDSSTLFAAPRKAGSTVDANLVSVEIFDRAMDWLERVGQRSIAVGAAGCLRLVAELGFYAGLRRSEAIGLTLGDVRGIEHTFLTVAPNRIRRLKTRNAYRNIPLHALMPRRSVLALRSWVKARRQSGATDADPLFPLFWANGILLKNHRGLSIITAALIGAAHDGMLRYHHLRHSFASRLLVQFWIAEQGMPPHRLPSWLLPTGNAAADLPTAQHIRTSLLGSAPTNRRSLMQISRLLGHASVEITLGSYVHTMDIVLGHAVLALTPSLPVATLARLAGRHPKHIERVVREWRLAASTRSQDSSSIISAVADMAVRARRHRPAKLPRVAAPAPVPKPTILGDAYASLVQVANALLKLDESASNVSPVAESTGLSESALLRWWRSTQGDVRIAAVPAIPRTKRQGVLAAAVVDSFGASLRADRTLRNTLVAIARTPWPSGRMEVRFARVVDARRWLRVLTAISRTCVSRWQHIPGRGSAVPSAARQRSYWAKALGVNVAPHHDQTLTVSSSRGSVELRCLLADRTGNPLGQRAQADISAVIFALTMLALVEC